MFYVYVLKSKKDGGLYIGCTNDLKKRIEGHNAGKSSYTKKYIPWQLIYYEAFISKEDAYSREHALKYNAQGLRRLKERLRYTLAQVM
ncbi:hypothetical protein CL629_03510 [bacterium]|nr:hypothetical protein [bacterium]|tara:strand:- start:4948 stop:5211 length:264 start_codon:yes stop_codon:yes gene_type:complete